ncbi:MAG: hypothetical protein IJ523_05115 [Succinivibrionaceae bacterium]|nr:hypothetical protein [Succinivibrionaceae bacterium]
MKRLLSRFLLALAAAALACQACGAGMTFGAPKNQTRSGVSASAMNRLDVEARCTNSISKTSSAAVTGLFCRLSGNTMNIYLALSDDALQEIASDPHAAANLTAIRGSFVTQACRRDSLLRQGSYQTVKYLLVDKYRREIASYTVSRTECL